MISIGREASWNEQINSHPIAQGPLVINQVQVAGVGLMTNGIFSSQFTNRQLSARQWDGHVARLPANTLDRLQRIVI